jgi:hypothetical protein
MNFVDHVVSALVAGVLLVVAQPDVEPPPSDAPSMVAPPRSSPTGGPSAPREGLVVGNDVSWPNCPVGMGIPSRRTLGLPMPPRTARFVVVGLTNGPAFHPNPCLLDQVDFARRRNLWTSAYAVVSYPTAEQLAVYGATGPNTGDDLPARLWNTGWAQAEAALASLREVRLDTPVLWVDVEPVRPPAPWSADVSANRSVLEGAMAAYAKAGQRLGVYSTQYLWRSVVGEVDYGLPEWRAAGPTSMRKALTLCSNSSRTGIQGGTAVLTQWLDLIDHNVLCPGRPATEVLQEFFTPL